MSNVSGSVPVENGRPTYFLQWDQRWRDKLFTITNNSQQTIGKSGCGPTSASMVINYFADNSYSPAVCADWVVRSGYRTVNSGSSYGMFKALAVKFGFTFLQTAYFDEAKKFLATHSKSACVCSMTRGIWTKSGHYILMYKTDGTNVYINDPNSTVANRQVNTVANLKSQCLQYFCFAVAEDKPTTWAPKTEEIPVDKRFIINCATNIYFCSTPSTSTISKIPVLSGTVVHATKKCGDWYYCSAGNEGWIPATYLDEANLKNTNSDTAVACLDAFNKLKDIGFIDSYDWWMTHVFDVDCVTNLVINIANCEDLKTTDSGKFNANSDDSIKMAIGYIYGHGNIINSPDYWISIIDKLGAVKYLIVKCANRI